MKGTLFLGRVSSSFLRFKIQIVAVNQQKPRRVFRSFIQRRHVDIQRVSLFTFEKNLAFEPPDKVISWIALGPRMVVRIDKGERKRAVFS